MRHSVDQHRSSGTVEEFFIFPRGRVPMAWPLHIQWKGAWYHITSRENERQLIFRDVEDRREFLGGLSRGRGLPE
ncbi:MAG: hypothetical protein WBN92_15585 [Terriglobia bacterium]